MQVVGERGEVLRDFILEGKKRKPVIIPHSSEQLNFTHIPKHMEMERNPYGCE
jgi:hypothetical protein